MPVVISPNQLYAKKADGTGYLPANVVTGETTEIQIAKIQAKANECMAQMASATEVENMFAGSFSSSTAYVKGQYVIQAITSGSSTVNKLFRFTADHAAGAWTGTDAVEVKICNDVSDLKSAINADESVISGISNDNYNMKNLTVSKSTADRAIANNGSVAYSVGNTLKEYAVTPGDMIMVTIAGRSSETYKKTYAFYNGDVRLEHLVGKVYEDALTNKVMIVPSGVTTLGVAQATSNTTNYAKKLSALLPELEESIFSSTQKYTKTDGTGLANSIIKSNYYGTTDGPTKLKLIALNGYKAFLYPVTKPTYFYCDSASSLFRIDTIENGTLTESSGTYTVTGTNAKEYSSGSLPTENSKILLNAGDYIIVTATNSGTLSINMSMDTLNNELLLNDRQVNQIEASIEIPKYPMLQYDSSGNGKLYVYIPNAVGYVRYEFLHDINATINADIWRIEAAVHVDDAFVQDYVLTTSGEWEVAIKIEGRSDFAGGTAHGDEVCTGITWIIDGVPSDITSFTTKTKFSNLTISEQSNLYDPNDSTTVFATHNSLHIFDEKGLTIRQSVVYSIAESIVTAYMAMLPLAQTVSNMLIPNNDYIPVSASNKRLYKVTDAVLYKTNGSVQTRFYVTDFVFSQANFNFFCVDNGGSQYNKCYFVNCLDATAVPQGTVWKSEAHYEFVTGE